MRYESDARVCVHVSSLAGKQHFPTLLGFITEKIQMPHRACVIVRVWSHDEQNPAAADRLTFVTSGASRAAAKPANANAPRGPRPEPPPEAARAAASASSRNHSSRPLRSTKTRRRQVGR